MAEHENAGNDASLKRKSAKELALSAQRAPNSFSRQPLKKQRNAIHSRSVESPKIVLKLHTAMRIRGTAKVICVAIVANQVLTTAFAFAVEQLDPSAPTLITTIFSFLTCGLVSIWLQTDARRAYLLAREKGCITPVNKTNPALKIAPDCPKLWLVVLHIEMNPAAVGL
jgi:hypothetical protein